MFGLIIVSTSRDYTAPCAAPVVSLRAPLHFVVLLSDSCQSGVTEQGVGHGSYGVSTCADWTP
jgi:hypothetical protein